MLKTKPVDETFALDNLEDLVLKKHLLLFKDNNEVGQVYQIRYNAKYVFSGYELQAEFYQKPISSDIFFEKGLIHREHVFEPLKSSSIHGIVLSKGRTGRFFSHKEKQNHMLIRPEEFSKVLEVLDIQKNGFEEFAEYRSSGSSMCGFMGLYYQPPGPTIIDRGKIIFLNKGKDVDSIKRKKINPGKIGIIEEEYRNDELVARTYKINDEFQLIIERNEITLLRDNEGLILSNGELLKKYIELYNKFY
ncbi:hypothetical protein HYV79_04210 [Candidatus Woesearchaeota archaeon]|nr:hypothetical protein [Candidatus Woesearchaeota archaeon]